MAHATFIKFDDIPYVLEEDEPGNFYDVPLIDKYADKGLIVDNGFILPYDSSNAQLPQSNTRDVSVPEPSSLFLLALGMSALIWRRFSTKLSK